MSHFYGFRHHWFVNFFDHFKRLITLYKDYFFHFFSILWRRGLEFPFFHPLFQVHYPLLPPVFAMLTSDKTTQNRLSAKLVATGEPELRSGLCEIRYTEKVPD